LTIRRSGRAALTIACLLTVPLLTDAQSAGNPGIDASGSAAYSAHVSGIDVRSLPDAPRPADNQNSQDQGQKPAQQQQGNQPSLGDLGFTPQQTQANAQLQARLNKRTHMLKVHQTLGLITLAPMIATVAVSGGATPKRSHVPGGPTIEPSSSGVDLHVALGSATIAMYAATAYYAIRAPKIPGVEPRGAIRLHRDLVWIHAPGMVLIPILGSMALNQENQGEKPHGIAAAHGAVAWTTVCAYGASVVAVSWPIHWKFWEH